MSRRRIALVAVVAALLLAALAARPVLRWFARGPWADHEAARLAQLAQIEPGMTVAEIGAGQGRLAVRLARVLGPDGRLLATELGEENLNGLRAAGAGITVIAAGEHSTNLPAGCCGVIYMRRVYHHLGDPEAITRSLHAALESGGRLVVIDMLSPPLPFIGRHGIAAESVISRVVPSGFRLEARVNWWSPIDYCLVFRKTN